MTTTLDPRYDAHLAALRETRPPTDAADAAQHRLVERLSHARTRPAPRYARLAGAAATACALVAIALLPMLASRDAIAFADVQRHFREFSTLVMTIDQTMAGTPMPRNTVSATRTGQVRVDIGSELSVVLDSTRGAGVSLLHASKQAAPFAFAPGGSGDESLDWLEELRSFQGQAARLPGTRVIDGETAYGWALDLGGHRTELWANADGLPLAMSLGDGASMTMAFGFAFDQPLDPARFSLDPPPGYQSLRAED